MQVIKDNQVISDGWERIAVIEEGMVLPDGDLIVPWRWWKDHQETLTGRPGRIAVCIDGDDDIAAVAAVAAQFELIALDFPAFKDGRCYSFARLLRERYQYQGDLRAVGDVLRDQVFYMKRCGISSFHIRADKDIHDALKALNEFTTPYQPAADGNPPIYHRRF